MDVYEHQKGAAIAAVRELDQDLPDDKINLSPRTQVWNFIYCLRNLSFPLCWKKNKGDVLPVTNHSSQNNHQARHRSNPPTPTPDKYVCVCFPSLSYKKYLHHIDANQATDDPQLFAALQQKYYDWKPVWKRIVTLRTLARVEYFEV